LGYEQTNSDRQSSAAPAKCARGSTHMGRGRAKAKQTKVARDLKYRTHETDFGALAKELHGDDGEAADEADTEPGPGSDEYDEWSDYSSSRD
jgi:hypothetical protein